MIKQQLDLVLTEIPSEVTLIAVSKTKPIEDILVAYQAGQRHFGENKVQEMVQKAAALPKDIQWHMIGHLQRNKVKYMASFVHMIHGVDSLQLLIEINKQAQKVNRVQDVLLQFHIAQEETKFGLNWEEAAQLIDSDTFNDLQHVRICGVMGMASFTKDQQLIKDEFLSLKQIY